MPHIHSTTIHNTDVAPDGAGRCTPYDSDEMIDGGGASAAGRTAGRSESDAASDHGSGRGSHETTRNTPSEPSRVPRLRWKPQDIAVGAALGAACGVIFWGFDFVYVPVSSVMSAILPGLMSVMHAFWYFSGTLALLVLRKPGAAMYVNLIGSFVESLIGNQFSIATVLIAALLQGVAAEIPFAVLRYRVFNLPVSIASGALTALAYGCYLVLFYYQGVTFASVRGVVHMIAELVGGIAISGVMDWYLFIAIAHTGVLERLASGRSLSETQRDA